MKKLNKQQLEAVRCKKGPLLIIAGAGTGKTTVVTERIKYIIQKNLAKPSEILALTFTEKAAAEMQERVDVALPLGYTQMWISTFHSFCDQVLRREALHIGLNSSYKLNTQAESIAFIRKNLFKFDLNYFRPLGNPNKFVHGMLTHFSRLQDEDVLPDQYLDWVSSNLKSQISNLNEDQKVEFVKWEELSKAYEVYEKLKAEEGMMDFGDLITNTLKLFRKRPNVLSEYKKQFKHILVDEFQDTNIAQYELLKLLVPPSKTANLCVVGDDSQSVYKFRGAAISNILFFKSDYESAKTIVLTKNYRSTQKILDASYKLIQFNNPDTLESRLGIDKNLKSIKKEKGEEVEFIHLDRVENEADEVAKEIVSLVTNDKHQTTYNYSDIAILVRANNHSEPFMRTLARYGIPYQFLGPGRLFKQSEIIDLIAYLKVLYDFEDNVSMYRILANDFFEINDRDIIRLTNYSKRKNISLFEGCERVDDIYVSDDSKEKIKKIINFISNGQKLIKKHSAGQILYGFLENSGLIQKLLTPDDPETEKKAKNISKLFDKLKTYETEHEDASVRAVVDWIDLATELGESPLATDSDWMDVNAVNILTVHSAKGLEFPVVFLVNLVSQRFPTTERREQIPIPEGLIKEYLPEGDYHTQEERRLFYVGMTRAKERLFLTAADYYGEGKREKKLSPFIYEALGDAVASSKEQVETVQQLSFLDYKVPEQNSLPTTQHSPPIHIDYLSYSQIETFRICPMHYKLSYIYKLPTPATSSQSFGNSFHQTMKSFYENIKTGIKPKRSLMKRLLEKHWINEGYLGKKHEKGSFEKALSFLEYYLENYFDPKLLPIALEQPFLTHLKNKIDGKYNFLKVGGKIDKITLRGDVLEIVDYKTGANPLTQKEADNNLQLSIYALAATQIPEPPFGKKPEKVKLSLMYFDNPQIITTSRTKEQLDDAVKEIFDYKKQIEESDFKCSGNILCQNCEYKLFCNSD